MQSTSNDITPAEAAGMLQWLVQMGADEVVLEQAVNRLGTQGEIVEKTIRKNSTVARAAAPKVLSESATSDAAVLTASCTTLLEIDDALLRFDGCNLRKSATRTAFIGGNLQSKIVLISDRARTEEDKEGKVFAGKNVVLLENMLKAIQRSSETMLHLSVVPWRPPGNRAATEVEARLCAAFAFRALGLIEPRAILSFGALAGQWFAGADSSIPRQRGKWMEVTIGDRSVPMISTFHPDDLIKTPSLKRLAWNDLLMFQAELAKIGC